jgi:hypothetical protein
VFRAVLAPDQGRWAYVRLGSAELFLFLLSFGIGLAAFVAIIVCAIPIAIVVALLAAAQAKAAAFLIAAAAVVVVLAIFIFALCRISLAGPMMVADGKFHLTDTWALTKGKAGDLFLIGFGVFLIIILIEIMLGAFAFAAALAVLGANFQGAAALFQRPPAEILTALAPTLAIVILLSIPVFGCLYAIIAAPWARAWRDLAGGAGAAI